MALRHQVLWARVAVTDRRAQDKPVEHIFERGQLLPSWVDDYTLFVLTSGGGAAAVEGPDEEAVKAAERIASAEPVFKQEHAPTLTQPLSSQATPVETVDHTQGERRATDSAASRATGGQAGATPTATPAADGKPAGNASKEDWERYAVTRGLSEEDAKKATRNDLVRRFG